MNGGIAGGEISGENRASHVGIHNDSSDGTDLQAKNIHLADISNQVKGEINYYNNSTSSSDPKFKSQQEIYENERETSLSNRNVKQNIKVKASQSTEVNWRRKQNTPGGEFD